MMSERPGRHPAWPSRLSDYVGEHLDRPFAWGRCDCCTWAAGWVELCTGSNPARDLIGTYASARGAWAAISRQGGFRAMVSTRLAQEPLSVPLGAIRGDLAAVPGDGDMALALGVVLGRSIAIMTPTAGLTRVPVTQSVHAWAVG